MSLNTYDLELASGKTVRLRLTARSIKTFAEKRGMGDAAPVGVVLTAVQSMAAMIDLLGCALKYPGAPNQMEDGADLIDQLADEGKGALYLHELVVHLAAAAGLLDKEEEAKLLEAVHSNSVYMINGLVKVLTRGEVASAEEEKDPT